MASRLLESFRLRTEEVEPEASPDGNRNHDEAVIGHKEEPVNASKSLATLKLHLSRGCIAGGYSHNHKRVKVLNTVEHRSNDMGLLSNGVGLAASSYPKQSRALSIWFPVLIDRDSKILAQDFPKGKFFLPMAFHF